MDLETVGEKDLYKVIIWEHISITLFTSTFYHIVKCVKSNILQIILFSREWEGISVVIVKIFKFLR